MDDSVRRIVDIQMEESNIKEDTIPKCSGVRLDEVIATKLVWGWGKDQIMASLYGRERVDDREMYERINQLLQTWSNIKFDSY